MTQSKSHQKLCSRTQYLRQHLEAVDAALSLLRRECKDSTNSGKTIDGLLPKKKYESLSHPVKQEARIINYSRAQNIESAIITLYRYFTEYLQSLLAELYETKPMLVVNKTAERFNMSFVDIVKAGSFEDLSEKMIKQVFRSLEEQRSTPKLLEKMLKGTDADVASSIQREALKYLEMRHLFVHGDGCADGAYANNYGADFCLVVGDKLPRNFETAEGAITAVEKLCGAIDSEMLDKGLVNPV